MDIPNVSFQIFSDNFVSKGYVDVCTDRASFRFRVLDDGGLEAKLTAEKISQIISQIIKDQDITLSRNASSRKVTVDEGTHAPIVLYMTNRTSTFISKILKFLRQFILEPLFGKKSILTKHIVVEFRKILEKLPDYLQKRILHDLRITKEEHCFLQHLGAIIKNFSDEKKLEVVKQALHGAYIQIEDGGSFYNKWVEEVPSKKQRDSSHASSAPQYSFQGPLCKECLFSKKWVKDASGEREVTWFQLERYPLERAWLFAHFFTWVIYKMTGENQGPHGTSSYTEANPLVI